MKRLALLIYNPGTHGAENYCAGVIKDAKNYLRHLSSPTGGLWAEDEIIQLTMPTIKEVQQAAKQFRSVDYAMIVFSGHGYYSEERDATILI